MYLVSERSSSGSPHGPNTATAEPATASTFQVEKKLSRRAKSVPPRESLYQTLKMRIRPDTFAYIPLALPAFREAGRCDFFTEHSDAQPKTELLLKVKGSVDTGRKASNLFLKWKDSSGEKVEE